MARLNILFISMMIPFFLFAQKKNKEEYVFTNNIDVVVDADLGDWQGNLYNADSDLWSFGISITNNKLFAAVKIKDSQLITEAIRNGILLNISYSDKKRDGAQLIFPRLNLEKLESTLSEEEPSRNFSREEMINSTKGYYLSGFSKVRDGLISLENSYGIHAVCKLDSLGYLFYEAEVPLDLIKFKTNKFAVELAVNTQYAQMKRLSANKKSAAAASSMYYRRGSYAPSMKNPYKEETSVWFVGNVK